MTLLLPQRLRQQPQFPVIEPEIFGKRIGPVLLGNANHGINGGNLLLGSGISQTAGPMGLAWKGGSGVAVARFLVDRPIVFGSSVEAITLLAVIRKSGTALDANHIAGYGSSSGGGGNTLFRLIGGVNSANNIRVQVQDIGGQVLYNTDSNGAVSVNDGRWHTVVATMSLQSQGLLAYYIDGVPNGTVTGAVVTLAATTFQWFSGCAFVRGGSVSNPSNFEVALGAAIYGFLGPGAAMALSANPYQIFRPARRTVYPKAAAAGGDITLSGTSQIASFTSDAALKTLAQFSGADQIAAFTSDGALAALATLSGDDQIEPFISSGELAALIELSGASDIGPFHSSGRLINPDAEQTAFDTILRNRRRRWN